MLSYYHLKFVIYHDKVLKVLSLSHLYTVICKNSFKKPIPGTNRKSFFLYLTFYKSFHTHLEDKEIHLAQIQ